MMIAIMFDIAKVMTKYAIKIANDQMKVIINIISLIMIRIE